MRLLALLVAVVVGFAFGFVVVTTNVFRPPAASDRLSGVQVRVASYSIDNLPNDRHRLHLQVVVTALRDLEDCLGFTLDEPFAGRRVDPSPAPASSRKPGRSRSPSSTST